VRSIHFLFLASITLATCANGKPFHFPKDTFSFSNQLYFDYQTQANGEIQIRPRADGKIPDYSRHCFVLVRSTVQFSRFAEFRPDQPKLSEDEYRARIKKLDRIPVWSKGPPTKIQIPGYPDLYSFSAANALLLQKNLGLWWPSYWRIGNWRIVFPVPRSGQERMAYWLQQRLDAGEIEPIFITRWRPINHCVIAYRYAKQPNGDLIFSVVDVNQPGKDVHLRYQVTDRSFYLDRTWYYPGGLVSVLRLFASPLF
jgi:hypothetical protein